MNDRERVINELCDNIQKMTDEDILKSNNLVKLVQAKMDIVDQLTDQEENLIHMVVNLCYYELLVKTRG